MRAHQVFDQIWESGELTRADAYEWLQFVMGLIPDECHIGLFSVPQCAEVERHVRELNL